MSWFCSNKVAWSPIFIRNTFWCAVKEFKQGVLNNCCWGTWDVVILWSNTNIRKWRWSTNLGESCNVWCDGRGLGSHDWSNQLACNLDVDSRSSITVGWSWNLPRVGWAYGTDSNSRSWVDQCACDAVFVCNTILSGEEGIQDIFNDHSWISSVKVLSSNGWRCSCCQSGVLSNGEWRRINITSIIEHTFDFNASNITILWVGLGLDTVWTWSRSVQRNYAISFWSD